MTNYGLNKRLKCFRIYHGIEDLMNGNVFNFKNYSVDSIVLYFAKNNDFQKIRHYIHENIADGYCYENSQKEIYEVYAHKLYSILEDFLINELKHDLHYLSGKKISREDYLNSFKTLLKENKINSKSAVIKDNDDFHLGESEFNGLGIPCTISNSVHLHSKLSEMVAGTYSINGKRYNIDKKEIK